MRKPFFPIDLIEHQSNVILYGAGNNARKLFDINEQISWCNIIAAVDVNAMQIEGFPVAVYQPDKMDLYDKCDFVLITILNKEYRREAEDYLIKIGVPKSKIVSDIDITFGRDYTAPVVFHRSVNNKEEKLSIGIWPKGTIGDHVIFLKFYQEIARLAPDAKITILDEFTGFPESILYGQDNLSEIRKIDVDWNDGKEFDLVLYIRFEPVILFIDFDRIKMKAAKLYDSMTVLYEYQMKYHVDLPVYQYENRILLDRAKFLNLNHYTLFNISGAFEGIKDQRVDLHIDERYKNEYEELKLNRKYVTYNYGAGKALGKDIPQVKQWPYEYHEKFNRLFKKKYPDIELIQLGGEDVVKIPGADRYILGKPLDVVKYILKDSLFHFDCEGGLVHIASQLDTKCFVVFGPTPAWFLGYENNENIEPKTCGGCKGLIEDWYTRCLKYNRPECVYSIKPADIMEKIESYLKNILSDEI